IRRSGRFKSKGPVIEENSIDKAIYVDEYLSDEEGSEYSGKMQGDKTADRASTSGFYVVENFDETTMEIKLENASLLITMESIADMIGIINEGVDIFVEHVVKDAQMIKNREDQFGGIKNINANHVKRMIRNSRVADMNFKLNFIVLFTLMFEKCKDGWENTITNSFCLGPLTLLTMMYVDGTMCKDFRVGRKRPPTTMWTKELLKERELAEIKSGGLGKRELAGPYVEEHNEHMPDNLETRAIVCETADKLYKESERKKMMDFSNIPSFSLGLTQKEYDIGPLDVVPLNFFSPTNKVIVRGCGAVTLTDRMKSPFYLRVVNADKVKNSEEKRLAMFLFNKRAGDDSDVMFRQSMGTNLERLTVLVKLQDEIDEEAILEEQILALMHRFADRVIKAIHGEDGKVGKVDHSGSHSCWLNIVHEINEMEKQGMKLESANLDSSFRRKSIGGVEQEQFDALADQIRDMIEDKRLPEVATKTHWIKVVPIKVNVHAWKIGRFHLFANPVRFERLKKLIFPTYKDMPAAPSNSTGFRQPKAQDHVGSYVNVVNGSSTAAVPGPYISFASALVLDESERR
nr:hypothetical protein [Tanacetum cinerariifolium]